MAIKIIKTTKESVLDPQQDSLNPAIWKDEKTINPEVKTFILDAVDKMGLEGVERVAFVGSNTGYQYTDSSDVDIHIWIPGLTKEQEDAAAKKLPLDLMLPGTKSPVQFYVIGVDESQGYTGKGAMWDLRNDKWIVEPKKSDMKVPISHLFEIAKFFIFGIDNRIVELEADEKELQHFETILKSSSQEDKSEIETRIAMKKEEIIADFDALDTAQEVLYGYRSDAYEGKQFDLDLKMGEGNTSVQAAVYKIIEELGYRQKIKDAMKRKPGAAKEGE